jgi:hypothetical protein
MIWETFALLCVATCYLIQETFALEYQILFLKRKMLVSSIVSFVEGADLFITPIPNSFTPAAKPCLYLRGID